MKLFSRVLFNILLVLTLFSSILLVYSVTYSSTNDVFKINSIDASYDESYEGEVSIKLENLVNEKIDYNIEVIYIEKNLVVAWDSKTCSKTCSAKLNFDKTFFGKYKVIVTVNKGGKFYEEQEAFRLDYENLNYQIELPSQIELDSKFGIDIIGKIKTKHTKEVKYTFEIFPKTAPENLVTFEKVCSENCDFGFNIDSKILIDDYNVNVYSVLGDVQEKFRVTLPYSNIGISEPVEIVNKSSNRYKKYDKYFNINSTEKTSNYFFYNNFSKSGIKINSKFFDRVTGDEKNKTQINLNELINLEFDIINSTVKKIKIPNARVGDVSLGFEKVPTQNIKKLKNAVNAFAIDPITNQEVTSFNVTFIAQSEELYKCKEYIFSQQDCYGNFVKILDTIPGQEYTITLTPEDPLFVELPGPRYDVQSGLASSTLTSFSNTISNVNQSQAFIRVESRSSSQTPDDWQVTPFFTSDTQVSFDRYSSGTNVDVSWQVIESNQFVVQRGIQTLTAGQNSVNISINAIDEIETFAIAYGRCADATGSDSIAGYFYADITNTTNLNLVRGQGSLCAATVRWQVVSWTGARVQKNYLSLDTNTVSIQDSLTPVNLSNSFLIFGTASIGSDNGIDTNYIRGNFTSTSQVTFNRALAGRNSERELFYYVVEHSDTRVNHYTTTYTTSGTQSINSVTDVLKSFYTSSISNDDAGKVYTTPQYTLNLSSQTTLDYTKQVVDGTQSMETSIIEFQPEPYVIDPNEVSVNITSPQNLSTDDLTCDYVLDETVGSDFVNWIMNSSSIMNLALPFEGGATDALTDLSNNSNDGTNFGASWSSNTGYDGNGSFYFDGATAYIDIGEPLNLDFNGNVNFTLTSFVNVTGGTGTDRPIICKGDTQYCLKATTTNYFEFCIYDSTYRCATSDSTLNLNQYYHLAGKVEGSEISLYVDGVKQTSTGTKVSGILNTLDNVNIGRDSSITTRLFTGYIDEARIFNRPLSQTQIQNYYNGLDNVIDSDETKGNETWTCSVTTFDSTQLGLTYLSNISISIIEVILGVPSVSGVTLTSDSGFDYVNDNLTCSYTPLGSTSQTNINWLLNSSPIMAVNLPFEAGATNALLDYSGNSNDATNNLATWNSNTGYNSSGAFTFSASSGQYLDLGSDPSIIYDGNSDYTFTFYLNTTQSAGDPPIISDKDWAFGNYNGYSIHLQDGVCKINIGDGFSRVDLDGTITVNDGDLHQCTFVLDDSENVTLYVDGVFDSSIDMTSINDVSSGYTTVIGNDGTKSYATLFNGTIDNVQIYDRALSKSQVENLYNNDNEIISSQETLVGETWACLVTPFDDVTVGVNESSSDVTIISLPPETSLILDQPVSNIDVYRKAQYDVVYNLSCDGVSDCDNINVTLIYDHPQAIGEVGELTLSNNEQIEIEFKEEYGQTPVLLAIPITDNTGDNNYLIPIIHSINKTHATLSLCEDAGLSTCSTTVEEEKLNYYIFDIDKSNAYSWIEVGYRNSITTDGASNAFAFGKTFSNAPYFFAQSQTYNVGGNNLGSTSWASDLTTIGGNFYGCDHPGTGDVCAGSSSENFGYVAIDMAQANILGLSYGSESISGSSWTGINYSEYVNPRIMVLQNSDVDAQDPQYPWAKDINGTDAQIRYCEADGAGTCDIGHSSETVVWMAIEDGFIETSTRIIEPVSTDVENNHGYVTSLNPQNFSLNSGQSTQVSYPLFFTGSFYSNYSVYATVDYGSNSTEFNASVLVSSMDVTFVEPEDGFAIIQNETFLMSANLSCTGFCGEIYASPRYNETNIVNTTGFIPMFTTSDLVTPCNPGIDGTCQFSWTVNATGPINSYYELDTLFNSSVFDLVDTSDNTMQIVKGPEIIFNQSLVNITDAIANYQAGSGVAQIQSLLFDQTNVNLVCVAGNCSFFSHNFSNGDSVNVSIPVDIEFSCLPTSAGNFSALFNMSSDEDSTPDTINISCSATELSLFVTIDSPVPTERFDIIQNTTFNLDMNVTCNTVGGCTDTQLGLYYNRDTMGETGSVSLQNFERKTIDFLQTYNQTPVVIAVPVTDTNADNNGLIPVISSVSQTGFSISLCEDAGNSNCEATVESETVHYYVFDIDKANSLSWIDVGYLNSVTSDAGNNQINFGKTFAQAPYLFTSSQTDNDGGTNLAPTSLTHTITTTSAQLVACDHTGVGDTCNGGTTENYGYVAIDIANHNIGDLSYGSQSIRNSRWTGITFQSTYTSPRVMVSVNSFADGTSPLYPWARSVAFGSSDIRYCEQDAAGVCDNHGNEVVPWLALEDGLIYIGSQAAATMSTTPGATPYYTTSLNPQTFTMAEGTTEIRTFIVNATDTIDSETYVFGQLDNGVDTQQLLLRTIGYNNLLFNITSITFDDIYQEDGAGVESVSLSSSYENNNITINCISGNCSRFITSWTNGAGLVEKQNQNINFLCLDDVVGNFNATFDLNSNNADTTNSINLTCNVLPKFIDIDLDTPAPLINTEVAIYETTEIKFNVTCRNPLGCNNVEVYASYYDENKTWWNDSWDYYQEISLTSTVATIDNYTFELELNETNVGEKFDWSLVCEDLRFIVNDVELNYWTEACSFANKKAHIYVKSNSPLNTSEAFNFSMYYGNSAATSNSNGTSTFLLFDDFENYNSTLDGNTPPTWTNYGSGTVNMYTGSGNRALIKTGSDDPNGGYISLSKSISNYEAIWLTNRINEIGGTENSYSISDSSVNGYGTNVANFGAFTDFSLENRSLGTASTLVSAGTFATTQNTWYRQVLRNIGGNLYYEIQDSDDNVLNQVATFDNTFTSFDRFYIHGGQEFLTDDIAIREIVTTEPTASFGNQEPRYSKIPSIDGSESIWIETINPQTINLTYLETKQVNYTLNTTIPFGESYDIVGSLSNWDITQITTINITDIPTEINLSLTFDKNRISNNSYRINVTLSNLANYYTPRYKNLFIYAFISNKVNITSPFIFDDSQYYNVTVTNETLNDAIYNGTIYSFELEYEPSLFSSVFKPFSGAYDNENSWNLLFNVTENKTKPGEKMVIIGFDPQKINEKLEKDIETETSLFNHLKRIIQIFINLVGGKFL